MKKKIVLFMVTVLSACILDLYSIDTPAATMTNADSGYATETLNEDTITPRAADTEWYYKTIDGKLYKRLYDKTNKKWLTDWIPC